MTGNPFRYPPSLLEVSYNDRKPLFESDELQREVKSLGDILVTTRSEKIVVDSLSFGT